MKTRLLLVAIAAVNTILFCPLEASEGWTTDYKAALATAGKDKKLVLLDFTGSDWCGWCIKLDKETFAKPEFKKFAGEKLVLVTLDFPRNKQLDAATKKQNEELSEKFKVEGFPTLVLVNAEGKEVARNVGYLAGGPEGLIKWVNDAEKN